MESYVAVSKCRLLNKIGEKKERGIEGVSIAHPSVETISPVAAATSPVPSSTKVTPLLLPSYSLAYTNTLWCVCVWDRINSLDWQFVARYLRRKNISSLLFLGGYNFRKKFQRLGSYGVRNNCNFDNERCERDGDNGKKKKTKKFSWLTGTTRGLLWLDGRFIRDVDQARVHIWVNLTRKKNRSEREARQSALKIASGSNWPLCVYDDSKSRPKMERPRVGPLKGALWAATSQIFVSNLHDAYRALSYLPPPPSQAPTTPWQSIVPKLKPHRKKTRFFSIFFMKKKSWASRVRNFGRKVVLSKKYRVSTKSSFAACQIVYFKLTYRILSSAMTKIEV